ncbi:MAG: SGNH/GDSL hydrolase family protein, partial [Anaerolineae bacterium]|nr:SGNH/GDSL hydrolase family protein [Anaerolineae bacterium]
MRNRWLGGFWAQIPLAATITGLQTLAVTADNFWIVPALAVMWGVTIAHFLKPCWHTRLGAPARWLRGRPAMLWMALLILFCVGVGAWLAHYQPTNGRGLLPVEVCYVLVLLWAFLFLLAYDLDLPTAREMGGKLSKSWLVGPLITLTTIVLIFFSAEAYLRLFNITTDGYGFTAMNYHWYKNFYFGHFNTFGYRDHEVKPDAPGLTRIAVVGDSFAAGHGINNIDDTFPQLLEKKLGDNYDVNLIAQSGWDTDVEEAWLNGYPKHPQIVILSYYLNDIDYLLQDSALNPDRNFITPQDPNLSWFVLNFFVPNYVYYNLLQYTSAARTGNFGSTLINSHLDDTLWSIQAEKLARLVDWSANHQARMIVLLWPMIGNVEGSLPATDKLRDFFQDRGVPVVNMADALIDKNPKEMMLNR